jgi:hypothetical protein
MSTYSKNSATVTWAQGHEPGIDHDGTDRFAAVLIPGGHLIACTVTVDEEVETETTSLMALPGHTADGLLVEQRHVDWLDIARPTRRIWMVHASLACANLAEDGYDAMGGICAESPAHALAVYLAGHTLPLNVPRATWHPPVGEAAPVVAPVD